MNRIPGDIDRLAVAFDEESLVSDAGLLAAGTLMKRLGLEGLLDDTVRLGYRVGGSRPGRKILSLVASMLLGGSHIDHADRLRAGSTLLRNRQSVEEGHNPRSGRTPTFQQAAAKVIELHSGKWRPGSRSRTYLGIKPQDPCVPPHRTQTGRRGHQQRHHEMPHAHMAPANPKQLEESNSESAPS